MNDAVQQAGQGILKHVLIVEDGDAKFLHVRKVVSDAFGGIAKIERACTLTSAEKKLFEENWNCIILDVSLDITSTSTGPRKGGHATLGGMDVANKMYLLGIEIKTVIVTAFDAFQSSVNPDRSLTILGLEDVERKASEILGESFLGCVRYGDSSWQNKLHELLMKV